MDFGLRDRRVLVTAATRGLGRASALALAAEGAAVCVAGRDPDRLARLVGELRAAGAADAAAVTMDLSDPSTFAPAVAEAARTFGGIDVFIGNTGGPPSGPFSEMTRARWQAALDETLLAMVDLCHLAVPHLISSGSGRIIFITTVGVKIVQPNMVLSDSLRLAMVGLAKSLSIELAGDGVTVNCLCPGPFKTDRMEDLIAATMAREGVDRATAEGIWLEEVPVGTFGDPADFGAMVALLASPRGRFVTGTAIALDGGKSRAY
ncbi:MAG: SDR family oxidoreductase [Rhizobiales bacterium]|nr:SDR family oxidoreductase [Hyphomicrobiales bacterium]